jgi:integrase
VPDAPRFPKLREKKGWFYADFYRPDRQPTRKWIALGTKNRRVAERKLTRLGDQYLRDDYDPWQPDAAQAARGPVSFTEAAEAYLKAQKGQLSESTIDQRRRDLDRFARTLAPEALLSSVQPKDVRDYLHRGHLNTSPHLIASNRKTKPLSDSTRQSYYTRLGAFFRWCIDNGYCEGPSPLDDVERPTVESKTLQYPNLDDLRRLREAVRFQAEKPRSRIQPERIIDEFMFTALTGLRISGLRAARFGDLAGLPTCPSPSGRPRLQLVDREKPTTTPDGHEIAPTQLKPGAERTIPLVPQATSIVERQRERSQAPPEQLTPLFQHHGRDVGTICTTSTSRRFLRFRRMAGLPDGITFHTLRKTCAVLLVSHGVPLRTVQQVLGHADPAVTAQIYTEVLDESVADDMTEALDKVEV